MKKFCFGLVGLGALAAIAGGVGWADCDDPAGNIELVEAPCFGVEKGGDGLWHNEFKIKKTTSGTLNLIVQMNCETYNPGQFNVSRNGGDPLDLSGGSPVLMNLTGGGATDTFHFTYSPMNATAERTAAVNFTPSGSSTRAFGWMNAPDL